MNSIDENADYASLMGMISGSEELLRSAWAMDCKALSEVLEKSHERLTSSLPYNNEQSLLPVIRLAFFYANVFYTVVLECPSGKGYADIAFIHCKPNIPAMLVELKVKDTVNTALDQIREKRYFAGLEKYRGNTLLMGISYDRKTKKHERAIERA